MRFCELGAPILKEAAPIVADESLYRFGQRRQRSLAVGGDREIGLCVALEVLVVAACEQVVRRDADLLRAGLRRTRTRKVEYFESDDEIRIGESHPAAGLFERMLSGEI